MRRCDLTISWLRGRHRKVVSWLPFRSPSYICAGVICRSCGMLSLSLWSVAGSRRRRPTSPDGPFTVDAFLPLARSPRQTHRSSLFATIQFNSTSWFVFFPFLIALPPGRVSLSRSADISKIASRVNCYKMFRCFLRRTPFLSFQIKERCGSPLFDARFIGDALSNEWKYTFVNNSTDRKYKRLKWIKPIQEFSHSKFETN